MSIHEVCLLAGGFAFLALLLRLSVDDIRTGFLYNRWVGLLAAAGLIMAALGQRTLFSAISGALLGGGLLFAVRMLSRGGIGGVVGVGFGNEICAFYEALF